MGTKKVTEKSKRQLSPAAFAIIERTQNKDVWFMAINRVPEPTRTEKIEAQLDQSIRKYPDLDLASCYVKLLKRDLTEDEIVSMIDATIQGRSPYKTRVAMARRLPKAMQPVELEKILEYYIKDGDHKSAEEARQELGRPYTDGELETLLRVTTFGVTGLSVHRTYPVIELFSEPKRTEELEKLLALQLEKEGWIDMEECSKLAKLIGRKLTKGELSGLLIRKVGTGSVEEAVKLARMLKKPLTVRQLEEILRVQKEEKYFEDMLGTIKLLPPKRRKVEYELLVSHYLGEMNYQKADEMVRKARRRLTAEEIEGLLKRLAPREPYNSDQVKFLCEQLIVSIANGR